jgi:hypothetical protein
MRLDYKKFNKMLKDSKGLGSFKDLLFLKTQSKLLAFALCNVEKKMDSIFYMLEICIGHL